MSAFRGRRVRGAMKARNRELLLLVPASLLVTAGFAGVFIQRSNVISNVSLTYGAIFLGLCLAGHIFLRMTVPQADPFLFPLLAVLGPPGDAASDADSVGIVVAADGATALKLAAVSGRALVATVRDPP